LTSLVSVAAGQLTAEPVTRSVAVAFDGMMRTWMEKYGVTRGSVAVMRNDRLVFAAGYGGRAANERVAVWSMTKAITALCAATLVQDNKLRFDDPIGPFLAPIFFKYGQPADERLGRVTIAQLLTHRSGLPYALADNRFAPGAVELLQQRPLSEATVEMLMTSIMKVRLATEPGSSYAYSNVGYLIVGQIIETVTGRSYETECGQRILVRAGINDPKLDENGARSCTPRQVGRCPDPNILASHAC
jgi:CubicO group peptidase (beta-lactamase class C family)